ncbi:unnamed protein product [Oncorhynchus mykiss]|uniref:Sleeping Beauty transposase HTH domain-containing protein n=1 Tax=Oncorhynchus mykiss TaxID=8022 RepID=A0A060Y4U5_ONCMY|nr:unnamed protein product [Oncorhynchus mykiss]
MRLKELELQDRIVSRHRSVKGYQNISAVLKVPKNTVASIILKWKRFGTTKTLPRTVRPAKLRNRVRRTLVRENLPEGQPSLQYSTNQAFMVMARLKPLLSKKAHDSPLGVYQESPKGILDHEKQDSLV